MGIEGGDYGRTYHLSLQPVEDPLKYRLRDLWVNASTYVTERARIGANFTDAATEKVPWTVRFQQIDGATYIAKEFAEQPIVGYHGLMYSRYSVSFGVPSAGALPAYAQITSLSEPLEEP